MDLVRIAAVAGVSVAFAGCQPKVENCWTAETKQIATKLANDLGRRQFVRMAKETWPAGKAFTADDRAMLEKSFDLSMMNFYAVSADWASGSLRCGAQASVKFSAPNGKVVQGDTGILEFDVHKAEGGASSVVINAAPVMAQLINSLIQLE
jgi:hypothetical protein